MANRRNEESRVKVLACVQKYRKANQNAPSVRDIVNETQIKSTSHVSKLLDELAKSGLLHKEKGRTRCLSLTLAGELFLLERRPLEKPGQKRQVNYINQAANICTTRLRSMMDIPLVGQTEAGEGIMIPATDLSIFPPEETVQIYQDMLPPRVRQRELFALRVKGTSMIDANINDDDYIILRRAEAASDGDMVVVWLDDTNETTLKYFFHEETGIRLQPANHAMRPIHIASDRSLRVIGQVILVVRSMEV